jgi:amino acid permease
VANKVVSLHIFIYYWFPTVSLYVWITTFYILTISFNIVDIRKIKGIIPVIKIVTLVGLIILGLVGIIGGIDGARLTGLDSVSTPVPCDQTNSTIGNCILVPGFASMNLSYFSVGSPG